MILIMSKAKLYFSRNLNPRLAVAAARFLKSPVEFEFASPFSPEQREISQAQSQPERSHTGGRGQDPPGGGRNRMPPLATRQFGSRPTGDSLPDVIR
jgi:glutathione S-transferase